MGQYYIHLDNTIDSISVLLDNGVIFCGDAAMSWPLWAGIKYFTIFITDVNKFYKSWEKIIKNGAKKVYPSHGNPFQIEKLKENIWEYSNDYLVEFFKNMSLADIYFGFKLKIRNLNYCFYRPKRGVLKWIY